MIWYGKGHVEVGYLMYGVGRDKANNKTLMPSHHSLHHADDFSDAGPVHSQWVIS